MPYGIYAKGGECIKESFEGCQLLLAARWTCVDVVDLCA